MPRTFIIMEDGEFFWIDAKKKQHNIRNMSDDYLTNSANFLFDWAADKKENRNLELSILRNEEERRDKIKKTEAGKLLYAN